MVTGGVPGRIRCGTWSPGQGSDPHTPGSLAGGGQGELGLEAAGGTTLGQGWYLGMEKPSSVERMRPEPETHSRGPGGPRGMGHPMSCPCSLPVTLVTRVLPRHPPTHHASRDRSGSQDQPFLLLSVGQEGPHLRSPAPAAASQAQPSILFNRLGCPTWLGSRRAS